MTWPPAIAKLVLNDATPEGPSATIPRTTLPSSNVTVPVGVPPPGEATNTAAVKVTVWPVAAGLTDDPSPTPVDARLTVSATAAEVLLVKPLVPAKEAVSVWLPTPSDTVSLAWPLALTDTMPSTVLPSRKVTVPVGTPPWEVTVAVSVSACPTTAVAVDVCSVVVVGPPCDGGTGTGRSSRPIRLPLGSGNHMLPSRPLAVPVGAL